MLDRDRDRGAYANIVLELDTSRRVKVDLLQCLSHNIVRLSLAGLGGLDGSGLVYISFVVDVELTEGICQSEYVALVELGESPVLMARVSAPLCLSQCNSACFSAKGCELVHTSVA